MSEAPITGRRHSGRGQQRTLARRLLGLLASADGRFRLRIYIHALSVLGRVRLALIFCPKRVMNHALKPRQLPEALDLKAVKMVTPIHVAVLRGSRWLVRRDRPCLPQALAAQRLLELRGIPAQIHLGFDPTKPEFGAHAWCVCAGGRVVGSSASLARRMKPLQSNPSSGTQVSDQQSQSTLGQPGQLG